MTTSTTPDGSDCVHGHALEDFVPQNADLLRADVEEPACLIHAPNESVAPSEIEHIALAEALFMRN